MAEDVKLTAYDRCICPDCGAPHIKRTRNDTCPECGGWKTSPAIYCQVCYVRLGRPPREWK